MAIKSEIYQQGLPSVLVCRHLLAFLRPTMRLASLSLSFSVSRRLSVNVGLHCLLLQLVIIAGAICTLQTTVWITSAGTSRPGRFQLLPERASTRGITAPSCALRVARRMSHAALFTTNSTEG